MTARRLAVAGYVYVMAYGLLFAVVLFCQLRPAPVLVLR